MKFLIPFIISLMAIISDTNCQISNYSEKEISDYIQSLIGGQREVSVNSGRVDLVHLDYAYEIEWANKWKESIGQSLWYALQLNKKPGIILLLKSNDDYKYYIQLNSALEFAKLENSFKILLFPNDFQNFMDGKK